MNGVRKTVTALTLFGLAGAMAGCSSWGKKEEPQTGQVSGVLPSFYSMDVNNDGVLTQGEVDNDTVLSNWDSIDTNHDNIIDNAEFSAFESRVE